MIFWKKRRSSGSAGSSILHADPAPRCRSSFSRLLRSVLCVLPLAACTDSSEQGRTRATYDPIVVDAITLRREFQDNEIRAEQKYAGRNVVVVGIVDRIGQDILGDGYVTFKGESLFNVQAMFEDKTELIAISPEQKLAVRCREVDGGDVLGVLLRTCTAPTELQIGE